MLLKQTPKLNTPHASIRPVLHFIHASVISIAPNYASIAHVSRAIAIAQSTWHMVHNTDKATGATIPIRLNLVWAGCGCKGSPRHTRTYKFEDPLAIRCPSVHQSPPSWSLCDVGFSGVYFLRCLSACLPTNTTARLTLRCYHHPPSQKGRLAPPPHSKSLPPQSVTYPPVKTSKNNTRPPGTSTNNPHPRALFLLA